MLPDLACARFQALLDTFQLGDADSLREVMRLTGSIISGSAALSMLHPDSFEPNDIDLYTPVLCAPIMERALNAMGYVVMEGQDKQKVYACDAIVTVSRFQKSGVEQTVNLVTTRSENPLTAVVQFHSTLVMNAITPDDILCLYPFLTLIGKGAVMVDTTQSQECFAKYHMRGFRFQCQFPAHKCYMSSAYCRNAIRSIDDEQVLRIPFILRGGPNPSATVSPFSWRLGPIV